MENKVCGLACRLCPTSDRHQRRRARFLIKATAPVPSKRIDVGSGTAVIAGVPFTRNATASELGFVTQGPPSALPARPTSPFVLKLKVMKASPEADAMTQY